MSRLTSSIGVVIALVASLGCAGPQRGDAGVRVGPAQLTPDEIAGNVTSFADTYSSHLEHVADQYFILERSPTDRAQAHGFLSGTNLATYTIATDPNPLTAALDMVVLVSLTTWAFERHWLPQLGDEAEGLAAAMRNGYDDAWAMAAEMLSPEQASALEELIAAWTLQHPQQRFVSMVRFADFADDRRLVHTTRHGSSSLLGLVGLDPLANLDPTTAEIERSRQLAERSFFYLKRLPRLIGASASQVYLDIAATSEAAQMRTNLQSFADSAAEATRIADELPERLIAEIRVERELALAQVQELVAAEREAAVDSVADAVRVEREALLDALSDEQPRIRAMLTELRQTLDSGTVLATRLEALAPAPDPERRPLDVNELRQLVEQTTVAAETMNELVLSMDGALDAETLETRLANVDGLLARAQQRGETLVNRAFMLAAGLVVFIFVLSVTRGLVQRRLARSAASVNAPS